MKSYTVELPNELQFSSINTEMFLSVIYIMPHNTNDGRYVVPRASDLIILSCVLPLYTLTFHSPCYFKKGKGKQYVL